MTSARRYRRFATQKGAALKINFDNNQDSTSPLACSDGSLTKDQFPMIRESISETITSTGSSNGGDYDPSFTDSGSEHAPVNPEENSNVDEALENAELLSRGSKNHHKGQCNPCLKVFWSGGRPSGCVAGDTCNFCHFQHSVADFQKRKKKWFSPSADAVKNRLQDMAITAPAGRPQQEIQQVPERQETLMDSCPPPPLWRGITSDAWNQEIQEVQDTHSGSEPESEPVIPGLSLTRIRFQDCASCVMEQWDANDDACLTYEESLSAQGFDAYRSMYVQKTMMNNFGTPMVSDECGTDQLLEVLRSFMGSSAPVFIENNTQLAEILITASASVDVYDD
jgi:hypothetical protein